MCLVFCLSATGGCCLGVCYLYWLGSCLGFGVGVLDAVVGDLRWLMFGVVFDCLRFDGFDVNSVDLV